MIGRDILQVSSYGAYWINEISQGQLPPEVNHTVSDDGKQSRFEIRIGIRDESIVLKTFKDMVSVSIDHANPVRYRHSVGMMGGFDQKGAMVARDGQTILDDPIKMAAEWQVKDDEAMLFQAIQGPQYPAQCIMPDAQTQEIRGRRLGESHAREAAEQACAHWADDIRDACIFDVMATGDLDAASAGAF